MNRHGYYQNGYKAGLAEGRAQCIKDIREDLMNKLFDIERSIPFSVGTSKEYSQLRGEVKAYREIGKFLKTYE